MTQPKLPEFVTPEPTTVEQTGPDEFDIHVDSGYRANVEYVHSCGLDEITYFSTRFIHKPPGWQCMRCGEQLDSDSAILDRRFLREKVHGTMMDMHELSKEIYVSNGDMGEVVTGHVMQLCVEAGDYSETFIVDAIKKELTP